MALPEVWTTINVGDKVLYNDHLTDLRTNADYLDDNAANIADDSAVDPGDDSGANDGEDGTVYSGNDVGADDGDIGTYNSNWQGTVTASNSSALTSQQSSDYSSKR